MFEGLVQELPTAALWVPFAVVLIGSALQVATGVGLGLIAAPAMLFILDGPAAVQTAIILNLTLTALLLPFEIGYVAFSRLFTISKWALIGIPLGGLLLIAVGNTSLKLISGTVVVMAVVQLRFFPLPILQSPNQLRWLSRIGGAVSGGMTGALAAPGPVALWALLSSGLEAAAVRATLRAYFLFAYIVALAVSLALAGSSARIWATSLVLLPAVVLGIGAGFAGRRSLGPAALRTTLELVLAAMGLSLLVKGLSDAGGF
ncbi:MAG: sulfite exporter TauE/SafE family protein [Hyphomicrobiales bacterium]|nr:sulfite exporter TauE/SafE family protein [Hyphomicrobiales bacterium]MCP5001055.1 sulfite exporter TauE/SafE family protein [Hyphomicrobiales bacterium]